VLGVSPAVNNDLINRIVDLPENEFWKLVSARLNIPTITNRNQECFDEKEREYWTEEYLVEDLFLQLARTKHQIVKHYAKCGVTVYKYYNQAFRILKWIPIAKPVPEFIVHMSDLELRTVTDFSFTFLAIGLNTRFSKFKEIGLKTPVTVYTISLTIAIIWGE